MRIIDLTHMIEEKMPVYPGTLGPSLEVANTHEKDGFKETYLKMYPIPVHMLMRLHILLKELKPLMNLILVNLLVKLSLLIVKN